MQECGVDSGLRDIVAEGFDAGVPLAESLENYDITPRFGQNGRLKTVGARAYFVIRPTLLHLRGVIGRRGISLLRSSGRRYTHQ
jgi:hypothetical protein